MRIDGKIAKWNDDRGFGFISPAHGGQEIFAHISDFPNDGQRPKLGEPVSFEIETDKSGRKKAVTIYYLTRDKITRHNQRGLERSYEKPSLVRRLMPLILVVLVGYGYVEYSRRNSDSVEANNLGKALNEGSPTLLSSSSQTSDSTESIQANNSDVELSNAYKNQTNNLQIEGSGKVVTLLPDDNDGGRHQRFIVRLKSGQTLLVAHNIDLASRITSLSEGDEIRFYGQYEWNEQGGVIHWTHNDPGGLHVAGWIEHDGKRYQ